MEKKILVKKNQIKIKQKSMSVHMMSILLQLLKL